ncbi:hypothetical protein BD413DRAFT_615841 [Trametes elegans]|nr:hypothetical protein BD413DRAFT_615841 [Trametes elegans]
MQSPLPTAASRALLCPEILFEIFDYLEPGRPDENALPMERARRREAQRTLASAARVCYTFSGPAFNILWRVLDELVALFKILPCFVQYPHSDTNFALERDPTEDEWRRFQDYAWRVREAYCERSATIAPSVWTFLARRCSGGQGLVPRLRRLDALCTHPHEPGRILLLTPTLRHLTLELSLPTTHDNFEESCVIATMVDVVRKVSVPHLQSLRITRAQGPRRFKPSRTSIPYGELTHLAELEIVSRVTLDRAAVAALAAFPRLRKLAITPWMDPQLAHTGEPVQGFPALRELEIFGSVEDILRFLAYVPPKDLDVYKLCVTQPPGLYEMQSLEYLKAVVGFAPRSLRRLELSFEFMLAVPRYFLELLEPASELDNLSAIAIRVHQLEHNMFIGDAELRAIVPRWPNLAEFAISVQGVDSTVGIVDKDDLPTIATLVRFAECHPRLVRLVWPFVDASALPPDPRALPLLDHALQVLRVSVVNDDGSDSLRRLAVLFDRLFSHLDLADVRYPRIDGPYLGRWRRWYDVEQLLLSIRIGREGWHPSPALLS